MKRLLYFVLLAGLACSCNSVSLKRFNAGNENIKYSGRTDIISDSMVVLIGSASSAITKFTGDTCIIYLKNNTYENKQNYFVIELDGEYLGRTRIEGDSVISFPIKTKSDIDVHDLGIYKATEASNGNIIICGIECESLQKTEEKPEKSIEFIGNSITCGFGVDYDDIPCHTGEWYDQHNAYFAYGPVVSRMLDVNYMLSSVSGIGIYRNWNGEGPVMPVVYENRYLNLDTSKQWDFNRFKPDIVSICLGTNDFSDGDGIHERLPFDEKQFTQNYIDFVSKIYSHYPDAQIALLSSPMLSGEKNDLLIKCLRTVQEHFNEGKNKPVEIFLFEGITPHGCDYHPDKNDEKIMAEQLYPFYKKLLDSLE